MAFPNNLTNAIDGLTEVVANHLNNLETKVGIDGSPVTTSLDYLLKNPASIEPGHKHSKLWASDGSPGAINVDTSGNISVDGNIMIGSSTPAIFQLEVVGISRQKGIAYFTQAGALNSLALDATLSTLHSIYNNAGVPISLGVNGSTTQFVLNATGIGAMLNGNPIVSCPGTTISSSGLVAVTVENNLMTYVATDTVTYNLPTGDLSGYIAANKIPLEYEFIKTAAGALTINPGTGNIIDLGGAGKTLYNSVAGETAASVTLRLAKSSGSINYWITKGRSGSWVNET